MKRIVNTMDGKVPELTPAQAMALLRVSHLEDEGLTPGLEAFEVLLKAYPGSSGTDTAGERVIHWQILLNHVLMDFVPAFRPGLAQGRPAGRPKGVVAAVQRLRASGEAKNIVHACNIIDRRKLVDGVTDSRTAYYRERRIL